MVAWIILPTGEVSWHNPSEVTKYSGYNTEEKYKKYINIITKIIYYQVNNFSNMLINYKNSIPKNRITPIFHQLYLFSSLHNHRPE